VDIQHFFRVKNLRAVLNCHEVVLLARFGRLRRVVFVVRVLLTYRLVVHHHCHIYEDDLLLRGEKFFLLYNFLHICDSDWLLFNLLEESLVQDHLPHVEDLVAVSVIGRLSHVFLFCISFRLVFDLRAIIN